MGRRRLPALLLTAIIATLVAPTAAVGQNAAGDVDRIAGTDRVRTAVEIAVQTYDQADTAVLATARNYPDALSGSVLAHQLGAPLLLVEPTEVPTSVSNALERLGVDNVVLLGGEVAISAAVEQQLNRRFGAAQVDRIVGTTRYQTAVRLAHQAVPAPDTVVLATGTNYPDAVSASALAASRGWPVLLTDPAQVPGVVTAYLDSLPTSPRIVPIGGPAAISDTALNQLRSAGHQVANRLAGKTRYATSHMVARNQLANDPTSIWVATGTAYPDALTAGSAAAATGGALHLTEPTSSDLPGTTDLRAYVTNNRACDSSGTLQSAKIIGGTAAIAPRVIHELQALLACEPFPSGVRLQTLVQNLQVASEVRTGYSRDLFHHWIDADNDCRDTRAEVLAAESRVAVSGCTISSGEWYSYYDGATWTQASDVDIDHMVPLAEAWDSGARNWNADTRQRFANDLGDARSLVAVTDNVNQSKSDRDPAEWLPDRAQCRYVEEWTAVKTRWSLTVDQAEKNTLLNLVGNCPVTYVEVQRAAIGQGTPPDPEPEPEPEPDCHPAYPDFCIPPPPPDKNCSDFTQTNFTVDHRHGDPHRLDGNGDGVACQS